jgi:hypothetical protein
LLGALAGRLRGACGAEIFSFAAFPQRQQHYQVATTKLWRLSGINQVVWGMIRISVAPGRSDAMLEPEGGTIMAASTMEFYFAAARTIAALSATRCAMFFVRMDGLIELV